MLQILSTFPLIPPATNSARTSLEKVVDNLTRIRSKSLSNANNDIELLSPAFRSVSVSLVDGTVSFSHPPGYPLRGAITDLEDAGFEVLRNQGYDEESGDIGRKHLHTSNIWRWGRFTDLFSGSAKKEQAHKDNCVACQQEGEKGKHQGVSHKGKEARRMAASRSLAEQDHQEKLVEGVFSVDGMTCRYVRQALVLYTETKSASNSSCTSSIEAALSPDKCEGVLLTTVLLVDNSVTILYHPSKIKEIDIIGIIDGLGFEAALVSRKPIQGRSVVQKTASRDVETIQRYTAKLSIQGMTCASCVSAITNALDQLSGVLAHSIDLMGAAGTVHISDRGRADGVKQEIQDLGYECDVVSLQPDIQGGKHAKSTIIQSAIFRVSLSIEGMTCASCTGAISNALEGLAGVTDVHIDLMGNAGTVLITNKETAERVKQEIEEMGYECEVITVTTAKSASDEKESVETLRQRTVNVRIDGFFCEHCPAKANAVLEDLSQRFDIAYTPSTLKNPTSALTYSADPPNFTLRTIRYAITELGFTLEIVKPESLQDRARHAQMRERQRLLFRLLICVIFCIPTFVLGVVGPSLLSSTNAFRQYLESPIWGSAPRYTIALFVLATPVQFGVGQFFYVRAYKSLRGVYRTRRGKVNTRKVWLDRIFRWGSMDSLVALGTTIAWASSLAYMILDITTPGTQSEMGYFDTSVFLLTFIIAGRYMVRI